MKLLWFAVRAMFIGLLVLGGVGTWVVWDWDGSSDPQAAQLLVATLSGLPEGATLADLVEKIGPAQHCQEVVTRSLTLNFCAWDRGDSVLYARFRAAVSRGPLSSARVEVRGKVVAERTWTRKRAGL